MYCYILLFLNEYHIRQIGRKAEYAKLKGLNRKDGSQLQVTVCRKMRQTFFYSRKRVVLWMIGWVIF